MGPASAPCSDGGRELSVPHLHLRLLGRGGHLRLQPAARLRGDRRHRCPPPRRPRRVATMEHLCRRCLNRRHQYPGRLLWSDEQAGALGRVATQPRFLGLGHDRYWTGKRHPARGPDCQLPIRLGRRALSGPAVHDLQRGDDDRPYLPTGIGRQLVYRSGGAQRHCTIDSAYRQSVLSALRCCRPD